MSGCKEYQVMISRAMDNDLNTAELEALHVHLQVCPVCKAVAEGFGILRNLLHEAFVLPPTPATRVLQRVVSSAKQPARLPRHPRALRIAALLVLTLTLIGGIARLSFHRQPQETPVVLGTGSSSVMNTPLGSLVYYEEFAGRMVHTQFTSLESRPIAASDEMTLSQNDFSGYESPLFDDEALLQDRYSTIITNAY